jgi:hypothetical protein
MKKLTHFVKPSNITPTKYRSQFIKDHNENILSYGDVYCFGVFSGWSMVDEINGLLSVGKNINNVWGFDSFCGLPKEEAEPLYCQEWDEGEFSSCAYLDTDDPNVAADKLNKFVIDKTGHKNTEMIVGFYKDSLVPNTKYKPAILIDIDTDIYSSALEALRFMFSQRLVVEGTVIIYDDWKGTSLGEGRAHIEIQEEFKVDFEHLCGNGERMYIVRGINA